MICCRGICATMASISAFFIIAIALLTSGVALLWCCLFGLFAFGTVFLLATDVDSVGRPK
jgi:hypothetical protein